MPKWLRITLAFALTALIGASFGAVVGLFILQASLPANDVIYRSADLLGYYQEIMAMAGALAGAVVGIGIVGVVLLLRR